jgi:type I restriction enzyme S subunit
MIARSKLARMDAQAKAFLETKYTHTPVLCAELVELWTTFKELGLPNDDFFAEFTSGKPASLMQRIWEMMLARHLHQLGYIVSCPGRGPDFRLVLNGTTVWVEAIAPEPTGLPLDWLEDPKPGEFRVKTYPHEQILLRWTSALDTKWNKLLEYRAKGIVAPNDAYVIAINGCQLGWVPFGRRISQKPLGVEVAFPIGPIAFRVDPRTGQFGDAYISERFAVANKNGTPIPTTPFVDPKYACVSAIMGSVASRPDRKSLELHVVHNPLADARLPLGSLGAIDDEWFATPVNSACTEFDLQQAANRQRIRTGPRLLTLVLLNL